MGWYTGGVMVNPILNAVLADSGPAPADTTGEVMLILSSTALGQVVFEHRNANNDANVHSHAFALGANDSKESAVIIDVVAGERIRVRAAAAIVGTVQVSMFSNII